MLTISVQIIRDVTYYEAGLVHKHKTTHPQKAGRKKKKNVDPCRTTTSKPQVSKQWQCVLVFIVVISVIQIPEEWGAVYLIVIAPTINWCHVQLNT